VTGLDGLPLSLRIYIVTIAVLGPAIALVVALNSGLPSGSDLAIALLLVLMAAVASHYQVNLSHQTSINVADAAYIAMIIVLPPGLPGALAMLAVAISYITRRREAIEAIFNTAQAAIHVSSGALVYWATLHLVPADPGWLHNLAVAGAVAAAAIAMHLVNCAFVSIAVALQLRLNPLRVWATNLSQDVPVNVALTAIGGIAAIIALAEPLALPLLALPVVLVRHAARQLIQLRRDTMAAMASMVDIIELRDPYTAGHSQRVAAMARTLALRLGLTAEEADLLEAAGRVHDIGKVAIDPEVLTKPGKLDEHEWNEMKLHPVHGAKVIERFNAWGEGYRLVRHHHEGWDGSGYPDGLVAESIPFGARILAVADTWDALTSDRPYRNGMSHERAIAILREGAGKQWDPRIVDALVEHLTATEPARDAAVASPVVPATSVA
jgi:HD-GYP domain-containing protein (c-di-GMP phosphodiesterase class II)